MATVHPAAVVEDFSDAALEDWTGPGIGSLDPPSSTLDDTRSFLGGGLHAALGSSAAARTLASRRAVWVRLDRRRGHDGVDAPNVARRANKVG
jgi:hypothetical protein